MGRGFFVNRSALTSIGTLNVTAGLAETFYTAVDQDRSGDSACNGAS